MRNLVQHAAIVAIVMLVSVFGQRSLALDPKNSATFNIKGCEGDSLPCLAAINGNTYFVPDGQGNYLYDSTKPSHVGAVNNFVDATGWTIEARVKVAEPNAQFPTTLVGQLSAGDDTQGFYQVNIAATRMYGINTMNYDFTQWTTIRMAKAPLEEAVSLWLNDEQVPGSFAPSGPSLARNWQVIGNGTSVTSGKLLIDYIRSDSTGAYAPGNAPSFGDYNTDGFVDIADYELWKNTFGSTTDLRADGNGSLEVDTADYAYWRKYESAGGGSGSGLAAQVPEPATLGALLVCGSAVGFCRIKRCGIASAAGN